jgi:hypothetical protein
VVHAYASSHVGLKRARASARVRFDAKVGLDPLFSFSGAVKPRDQRCVPWDELTDNLRIVR